jgi:hypothetical protein
MRVKKDRKLVERYCFHTVCVRQQRKGEEKVDTTFVQPNERAVASILRPLPI